MKSWPSATVAVPLALVLAGWSTLPATAQTPEPRSSQPSGQVVDWGRDGSGASGPPAGLSGVVDVAAADSYALALTSTGTVVGWGSSFSQERTPPSGLTDVVAISAAMWRAAALRADGSVVTWGSAGGDGSILGTDNIAVSAGTGFTLALKADHSVRAEGTDLTGQTDVPAGLSEVTAIAAGGYRGVSGTPCGFGLALQEDGMVVGWGGSLSSGLGCGSGFDTPAKPPSGLSDVTAIAAGSDYSLAVRRDGTVVSWGRLDNPAANPPAGLQDVVAVSAGPSVAIALRADGSVVSWGAEDHSPAAADLASVSRIAAGNAHQVAVLVPSVVGTPVLQAQLDSNPSGVAEAFQFVARSGGPVDSLHIYLDADNRATQVQIGLYSGVGANPGTLMSNGTVRDAHRGQWNAVDIPATTLTRGAAYWVAVLAPQGGGRLRFRDRPDGLGGPTQTSAQTGLVQLPQRWRTGRTFTNAPLSGFASPAGG